MLAEVQYRFGPFVFDIRSRVLYRDARLVNLPPKAADVLALLLTHAGSVVDKPALLEAAWAGRSVGESSLTRTISILRAALCDAGTHGDYITTVSKRGYRFSMPVTRSADEASMDGPVSIAVLPLNDFNGGQPQEAFCQGLMEEITSALHQRGAGWLRVLARTSCMAYRNTSKRIGVVGRELGVHYVLEGSVRASGRRIRIASQLIRVADEMHVWAENYERRVTDELRLQCVVASQIALEVLERLVIPVLA